MNYHEVQQIVKEENYDLSTLERLTKEDIQNILENGTLEDLMDFTFISW